MSEFPKRWSIPIKDIRRGLKNLLIDDCDKNGNPIKRILSHEEIDNLVSHWKDMVKYSKDRFKSSFHPDIMKSRPYLQFSAVDDLRCCAFCKNLHHKIIHSSDPRSVDFFPPLHIGCRCGTVTLSDYDMKNEGLTENFPLIEPPDIFMLGRLFIKLLR